MINQAMHMFEQFMQISERNNLMQISERNNLMQISERNNLGFFAGWCALALVLAFTIVYVWNKINELVEKKKQRNDISLGSAKND